MSVILVAHYCVYCGKEIDENNKNFPHCSKGCAMCDEMLVQMLMDGMNTDQDCEEDMF